MDDDSARHSAALRYRLKEPLATVLTQYFNEEKIQPDWSTVASVQIQVLVDGLGIGYGNRQELLRCNTKDRVNNCKKH